MEKEVLETHKAIMTDALKDEPKPRSKAWMIIGAVLTLLVIFYVTLSEPLMGLIGSTAVKEDKVSGESIIVMFEGNTLDELQKHYVQNEEREVNVCLKGKVKEKAYEVQELYFPEVIDANVVHILTEPCPLGTIIDLHSHPVNKCTASDQDMKVFSGLRKAQPSLIMMIMCNKDRFRIYETPQEIKEGAE